METSAHDRSTVEKHLATARERLLALSALLDNRYAESSVLRGAVVSALGALNDAHSIVADPREVARVGCPYCGFRVMSDATLCLSCWRKLDPEKSK